jgi:hypothetical protein
MDQGSGQYERIRSRISLSMALIGAPSLPSDLAAAYFECARAELLQRLTASLMGLRLSSPAAEIQRWSRPDSGLGH